MQSEESKADASMPRRIVLVGGGHAHVQVIKGLHTAHRPPSVEVTLIDKNDTAFYSGMMPGCVAGLYQAEDTHIQLKPLAAWAGITFIRAEAAAIDSGTAACVRAAGCAPVSHHVSLQGRNKWSSRTDAASTILSSHLILVREHWGRLLRVCWTMRSQPGPSTVRTRLGFPASHAPTTHSHQVLRWMCVVDLLRKIEAAEAAILSRGVDKPIQVLHGACVHL